MDAKHLNPFLAAVSGVLEQFGLENVKKGSISIKEDLVIDKDVTAFIGIVGDVRGNIAYAFDMQTAKNLVSTMMMGMDINEMDDMARSAIAELANMFTGNAVSALDTENVSADISTPSVVVGEDMYFILGTVKTLVVEIETQLGIIEVNFGME